MKGNVRRLHTRYLSLHAPSTKAGRRYGNGACYLITKRKGGSRIVYRENMGVLYTSEGRQNEYLHLGLFTLSQYE